MPIFNHNKGGFIWWQHTFLLKRILFPSRCPFTLSLSLSYLNQPLCEWGDSLLFVTLWLYLKQPFLSFLSSFLWWALDFSFGFPVIITWEVLGCSNWSFCEEWCVWGLTWLRLTLKDWNLRGGESGFCSEFPVGGWCLCCFSVLWQVWDPWGTELIHGVMRYVYCVVISFWLLCLRLVLELAPILVFWSVNQWIVIVNLNLVCYAFVLALKLIISCFKFSF